MQQKMLDKIKSFSADSKIKIENFIEELFKDKYSNNIKNISNQKQHQQQSTNDYPSLQELFNNITVPFSVEKSREISKNQRNFKLMNNNQYNYGQIKFNSICKAIKKIAKYRTLDQQQVFYDLGSGSGKVIFAASLCYSFQKCKGIEVLESLYKLSLLLKQRVQKNRKIIQQSVLQQQDIDYQLPQISFYNMDFKNYDWSDSTITFISSTCYSSQLMKQVFHLSKKMRKGTIFVTLTRKLDLQQIYWKVVEKFTGQSSWGQTTIYIHVKIV